jgi:ribosomal protein L29
MKTTELRKLSDKELEKLVEEKRAAVQQFRFDVTGSKVKNIKTGSNAKKDVARILTELASRSAN